MMEPQRGRRLIGFCVLTGLAMFLWGGEIYQRAEISLNGKVVSSETKCVQPQNNRCATTYIVESLSGLRKTYVAGPNTHSLPRRLPIGTIVVKEAWKFDYSINGEHINDFPLWAYSGGILTALIGSWWLYWRPALTPNTSLERTREE
jgi:hypothetical protein